jgi:beta-glucosidase
MDEGRGSFPLAGRPPSTKTSAEMVKIRGTTRRRALLIFLLLLSAQAASATEPFQWCVSTAGHQIEGENFHSDWWAFEQKLGTIAREENSSCAADSWHRLDRDLQNLRYLGVNMYRFSVEWSRVEPSPNIYDDSAIEKYRTFIMALQAAGIEPMITLSHFTLPLWFRKLGAWEHPLAAERFSRFAKLVRERIAPNVRHFVTFNEPMVHAIGGYFAGSVPPEEKRPLAGVAPVIRGMLMAHAAAYRKLHSLDAPLKKICSVGVAQHIRPMHGSYSLPWNNYLAKKLEQAWSWAWVDAVETGWLKIEVPTQVSFREALFGVAGTQDFAGINYYTVSDISVSDLVQASKNPDSTRNDLYDPHAWKSRPDGLISSVMNYDLKVKKARGHSIPIYITENGIADANDQKRPTFLKDHLRAIDDLRRLKIPLQGYCHWSLMDNFEWIHGYEPRFGLFETDFSTFQTTPRPSANLYRDWIKTHR